MKRISNNLWFFCLVLSMSACGAQSEEVAVEQHKSNQSVSQSAGKQVAPVQVQAEWGQSPSVNSAVDLTLVYSADRAVDEFKFDVVCKAPIRCNLSRQPWPQSLTAGESWRQHATVTLLASGNSYETLQILVTIRGKFDGQPMFRSYNIPLPMADADRSKSDPIAAPEAKSGNSSRIKSDERGVKVLSMPAQLQTRPAE